MSEAGMLVKRAINKGLRLARKWKAVLFPPLKQEELFPTDVLVHFSHHKCLTAYYEKVISGLSDEFRFWTQPFHSDMEGFVTAVINGKGKRVLRLNNRSHVPFETFPVYRGSHFIRDPRDLIVSGYRYHLWTQEPWCVRPDFDWSPVTELAAFAEHIEQDSRRYPLGVSYQEYLKRLDPERGLLLELLWRQGMLHEMGEWNYQNTNIIELRYEDIIGNEGACFERIFRHYGFHAKMTARGVALAEQFSLKNTKKSESGHVRKGTARQWQGEFTPGVTRLFKELNGDLLVRLGYEKDLDW